MTRFRREVDTDLRAGRRYGSGGVPTHNPATHPGQRDAAVGRVGAWAVLRCEAMNSEDAELVAAPYASVWVDADSRGELELLERRSRAFEAAVELGSRLGLDTSRARVLQDWNDTIVHLAPEPVVARVRTSWAEAVEPAEVTDARELAVVRHAVAHGAPVVPPAEHAGPFTQDGLAITLWQHAEELPDEISDAEAGAALLELHCALADFSGDLPPLSERLGRAASVISSPVAVPRLASVDRAFLAERFAALRAEAESSGRSQRVLHGGPHTANLLATLEGPRWIDFDTTCRGPVEWDLAHLGDDAAALFPDSDAGLLASMRKLVSADVAIWCWHTYGRAPEVDEAAHYHLEALRS